MALFLANMTTLTINQGPTSVSQCHFIIALSVRDDSTNLTSHLTRYCLDVTCAARIMVMILKEILRKFMKHCYVECKCQNESKLSESEFESYHS